MGYMGTDKRGAKIRDTHHFLPSPLSAGSQLLPVIPPHFSRTQPGASRAKIRDLPIPDQATHLQWMIPDSAARFREKWHA
jgi:hypothetical protein